MTVPIRHVDPQFVLAGLKPWCQIEAMRFFPSLRIFRRPENEPPVQINDSLLHGTEGQYGFFGDLPDVQTAAEACRQTFRPVDRQLERFWKPYPFRSTFVYQQY